MMKRMHPTHYTAPALDFESKTGLTGIHTPWTMPEGLSHDEQENQALVLLWSVIDDVGLDYATVTKAFETTHTAQRDEIVAMFDRLVSLNPALKELHFLRGDVNAVSTVIGGVASQFNIDDIHFMSTVTKEAYEANLPRLRAIEQRCGIEHLNWVPSPKTCQRINDQLDALVQFTGRAKSPAVKPGF